MLYAKQLISFLKDALPPQINKLEKPFPSRAGSYGDNAGIHVFSSTAVSSEESKPHLDQHSSSTLQSATKLEPEHPMEDAAQSETNSDNTLKAPSDPAPREQDDPGYIDTPASTSRERISAGEFTIKRLEQLTRSLNRLCRESDPQFVRVGRDLATVSQDVRKLTDTVRHAVSLIQNDQGEETSLKKTEELVQDVFTSLEEERKIVDESAVQVENLVSQIFQCQRIREMIDRINSLFRIVRINIRIQCSARGLNEELFEGVSEDLDHLSKTLHQVTKQILLDINQGTKSLVKLQKSIAEHIDNIDRVFQQTKTVVSKAFHDIRQLMQGAETMIRSADAISKKVSDKVGEVVVSIQFHDSLSQRIEHIVHAFADISKLCGSENGEISEEHLGTSFIILDLQQRQLVQIRNEIRLVRERIESDFLAIESEVAGLGKILHDKQFRQVGPQQFLGTFFSSLEGTLVELNFLLAEGDGMLKQIEKTADGTRIIAKNLAELKKNVTEIREETRVQAVNTIIMASNLGHQGKTIEVLAKEIQSLSDKSSVLADDVEAMQLAVSQTVEDIIDNTARTEGDTHRKNLTEEIRSIKSSFSEVMDIVSEITRQIEISAGHIKTTRMALVFLDTLESLLDSSVMEMNRIRNKLASWENKGTHDSEEIEQLVKRYSMAQERMIHMFDRVDAKQDDDDDDDVFF